MIDEREPYDVDMLQIIRKAAAWGCHLELNAHPERLDLLDSYCRMAKDEGVLVSHRTPTRTACSTSTTCTSAIGQARRGWLAAGDVLNTRGLAEVRRLLARKVAGKSAAKGQRHA